MSSPLLRRHAERAALRGQEPEEVVEDRLGEEVLLHRLPRHDDGQGAEPDEGQSRHPPLPPKLPPRDDEEERREWRGPADHVRLAEKGEEDDVREDEELLDRELHRPEPRGA